MTPEKLTTTAEIDFNPELLPETWRAALQTAIKSTDEAAIWEIMNAQQLNAEAHEELVNSISRLHYRHRNIDVYCELFMMPVIVPSECELINEPLVWKSARDTIKSALNNWFGKKPRIVIFEGVLPMDWITTWRPRVIRQHLQRLVPESSRQATEFPATTVELPERAPRLGFVLIACQKQGEWPEKPELNSLMDKRLKDVVRSSLYIAASPAEAMAPYAQLGGLRDYEGEPLVLAPERIQFAITDGIVLWLMKLHAMFPILGWTVSQSVAASDVVKFTLHLADPAVRLTQFTVRMHQIGMQGLNDITIALAGIAPNMETPADMSNDQYLAMQTPSVVA